MSEFSVSVSQLNKYVADRLLQDAFLQDLWVEGEISTPTTRRGICYFTLMDSEAAADCIIFKEHLPAVQSLIEHGSRVHVHGDVTLYRKTGRFRIMVRDLRPAGIGKMYLAMLELRRRLTEKGYFDEARKRPLPPYPRSIAVVTSKEGAALQDILNVAARRNPQVALRIYPTRVQGEQAPEDIARAVRRAAAHSGADILIIARGGGSSSDLSAFDDERVVRAVAESTIPTISAVGHETDISFCDLAADRRVPTPSAAAEIAVPDRSQIIEKLEAVRRSLREAVARCLTANRSALETEKRALRSLVVTQRLDFAKEQLRFFERAGPAALQALLDRRAGELRAQKAKLEALNPMRILKSGYAVVLRDGLRISSAAALHAGDSVELLFADGQITAHIGEDGGEGKDH